MDTKRFSIAAYAIVQDQVKITFILRRQIDIVSLYCLLFLVLNEYELVVEQGE